MELVINVAVSVALLLLMLSFGALLKKLHMTSESCGKDLSNILLYVAQPALILSSFLTPFSKDVALRMGVAIILAIVSHLIFIAVAFLSFRKEEKRVQTVLRFSVIFSNVGYMGFPVISYALGQHAIIYASMCVVIFNILAWTLGCYMYTGNSKYFSLKKIFLNPTIISIFVGFVLYLFDIGSYIQAGSFLFDAVDMLKALVAPLSMFVIGFRIIEAIKNYKNFIRFAFFKAIAFRLLLCPLATFLVVFILKALGIFTDALVSSVVVISAATPAATITGMFAEKFDGDAVTGSALVSVSTALSLATLPLVTLLLNLL